MESAGLFRRCGAALAVGALLCGAAITAEAVTDPSDADRAPHYVASLAAPVALVLFGGILVLLIGFAGLFAFLHRAGDRGQGGALAMAIGLAVAEIPHTILDFSANPVLFDRLPGAQAHDLVENHISSLPGLLSGIGVLPLLIGSIVLAVRQWRHGALPRWAPRFAIACLVLAIAELPLSGVAWWLPHGPVLLYVGLAGYGAALMGAARRAPVRQLQAAAEPAYAT
jgi:hypothetical protein